MFPGWLTSYGLAGFVIITVCGRTQRLVCQARQQQQQRRRRTTRHINSRRHTRRKPTTRATYTLPIGLPTGWRGWEWEGLGVGVAAAHVDMYKRYGWGHAGWLGRLAVSYETGRFHIWTCGQNRRGVATHLQPRPQLYLHFHSKLCKNLMI